MTRQTTAGTAGRGYKAPAHAHEWQPTDGDPGERVRCRTCGRERHEHLPRQREGSE